jgi:hypothetical protein
MTGTTARLRSFLAASVQATPLTLVTYSARSSTAGATWWDERQLQSSDQIDQLAPVLSRIEQGPPAL